MVHLKIVGTGSYLPHQKITNEDLAKTLPQTSDEWIFSHTGIKTRYLAGPEDTPSGMGLVAAQRALEMAGLDPKDLGFILLSSTTTDYAPIPQTSCLIQRDLGAVNAVAFDLTAACCGFTYNLEIARGLVQAPFNRKPILVVATEMMSRLIDWQDYKTCVLFGDGAGAVVLMPTEEERGVMDTYMRTDGSRCDCLKIEGGCRTPDSCKAANGRSLYMEGKKVFAFAIKALPEVLMTLLERNHLTIDDIKKIVPHQANYRIIHSAGNRLGLDDDRFYLNVERYANTASASIPIALDEMNRSGDLLPGDRLVTASFGAGLTYGGNYIVW